MKSRFVVGIGMLGILAIAGCSGGQVKPKGQLLKDGQPFTLGKMGVFTMSLVPEGDTTGVLHAVSVDSATGAFEVNGQEGKGVLPGKYKVVLEAFDPYPGKDLLKHKYSWAKTNLVVDVTVDDIKVDVGK